jgi:ABC-type dipeptide/oligopeptide/nickel transport system permease component
MEPRSMWSYLTRRLLQLIPVWIATAVIVWAAVFALPGDPALLLAGEQSADPEVVEAIRTEWGLDRPAGEQLATFLGRLVRLDLGRSYVQRREVSAILRDHFPPTFFLAFAAMALTLAAGVAAGAVAALWRGRWPDRWVRTAAAAGLSAPAFWVAILLALLFASWLRWLPGVGYGDSGVRILGAPLPQLSHLILPAASLAILGAGVLSRLVRGSLLETLSQEYVRACLARGASSRRAALHALRTALLPIATWSGLHLAALLGGAVATETVFAWPGLGRAMVTAIAQRDLPVVEGGVLLLAAFFVLVNLLVDLSYVFLDPRLRSA